MDSVVVDLQAEDRHRGSSVPFLNLPFLVVPRREMNLAK